MAQEGSIKDLDVVALVTDQPKYGLVRGQVGTVVAILEPGTYEVEFSDDQGRPYAQAPFAESDLMVLHYSPTQQAA